MKEQSKTVILPLLPIVGHLKLTSHDGQSLAMIDVVSGPGEENLSPFFKACFQEFERYLKGESQTIKIPLDFSSLTSFQNKVLIAMKEIPYGQVASYKDLAIKLNSKAYQAIGNACGSNPFLLIYPCHRVIGSKGPGGFAHGPQMKKELLKLEGHHL